MEEKFTFDGSFFNRTLSRLLLVFLIFYPLRHVHMGIDWWDTGYNYSNFVYMGLEHMDSMWLFSTYLATAVGHIMTLLPQGGTLVGLNIYTGLLVSGMAAASYLFCTKTLKINYFFVFLGEFIAVSMCWCPTSLLYNYLTYFNLLLVSLLLYYGLSRNKNWMLILAGVALGLNIFVRFSNLPEAILILAVWAYGVGEAVSGSNNKAFATTVIRTLWCLAGYMGILAIGFLYIQLRYGIGSYIDGIARLFAMTEHNSGYTATSMVYVMIRTYLGELYWVARILLIVLAFTVLALVPALFFRFSKHTDRSRLGRDIYIVIGVASACAVVLFLVSRGYTTTYYTSYDPVVHPNTLFLIMTYVVSLCLLILPKSTPEQRFLGMLMILVVTVTSLGSNNGIYPSMNNMFLTAPICIGVLGSFIFDGRRIEIRKFEISLMPFKITIAGLLLFITVQVAIFGYVFVFCEATGLSGADSVSVNNQVLAGVTMRGDRATAIDGVTGYITEKELKGTDVVLYGKIPAVSFYLELPPAFNSWADLDSYSITTMESDMQEMKGRMTADPDYRPLVILSRDSTEEGYYNPDSDRDMRAREKYLLIRDFMDEYGYELQYENEKFLLYR